MDKDRIDLRPNRHKELIYCSNCKCSRRAPCTCKKTKRMMEKLEEKK